MEKLIINYALNDWDTVGFEPCYRVIVANFLTVLPGYSSYKFLNPLNGVIVKALIRVIIVASDPLNGVVVKSLIKFSQLEFQKFTSISN